MHKIFLVLIGFVFLNNSFAQQSNKVCAYAFSMYKQPGTIQGEENGTQISTERNKERFIYITVPGKNKPEIKNIRYNKIAVKWDVLRIAEREYATISESTQKALIFKPIKGGSMWRINILEFDNHPLKVKETPIVIEGKIAAKPFAVNVSKEIVVQGYDSY